MKLIEAEGGSYQVTADGANPQNVRLEFCSSCPVNHCTQMLDEGYARIAMPKNKENLEAVAERIEYVRKNGKCLTG